MRAFIRASIPFHAGRSELLRSLIAAGETEKALDQAMQIINLWAPWCGSCEQLLPRPSEMFGRRGAVRSLNNGNLPLTMVLD